VSLSGPGPGPKNSYRDSNDKYATTLCLDRIHNTYKNKQYQNS